MNDGRPVETVLKTTKGHCFGEDEEISGMLVLTNIRIYLQVNEEKKVNELILRRVKKVSIGGLNVLRFDMENGERYNFLVTNVIGWLQAVKKALKSKD